MAPKKIELSREHIAAVERNRRLVVNYDAGCANLPDIELEKFVSHSFDYIDDKETQIDSVWWGWGGGNEPWWPSKVIDDADMDSDYRKFREKGIDIVRIFLEETKKRGLEVFFTYRVNSGDMRCNQGRGQIEMKQKHPDWQIDWSALKPSDKLPYWELPAAVEGQPNYMIPWNPKQGLLNYAVPGVRDYRLSILREVAEQYDFDGIDIDFGRMCPVLPVGHQWEHRQELTDFMRELRLMLLEVERQRGRPYLLSARIPETIVGCHFDGIDVETWASEQLLDILCLGVRSFDVDVEDFRYITAGRHIKLYPSCENMHYPEGYDGQRPGDEMLQVFRGVFSNFFAQGADGILAFNFSMTSDEAVSCIKSDDIGKCHRRNIGLQAMREGGSLKTLRGKDKIFPVQRRGGGHPLFASPRAWVTPRVAYMNSNMLGQLPVNLANDGKGDTLFTVMVGDDVNADAKTIDQTTIRALLSDPAAEGLPDKGRLELVDIPGRGSGKGVPRNIPPAKSVQDQIELRLNNILLERPGVEKGWLVFTALPRQFAMGKNLVGVRVTKRPPDVREEITVEKLEVHVKYR